MKKNILITTFALFVALASVLFFSFKKAEPAQNLTEHYWVLKSGYSISTSQDAYQQGSTPCSGNVEFCGFYAPMDGSSNKPVISGATLTDLDNLSADPETPSNESGKISYRD